MSPLSYVDFGLLCHQLTYFVSEKLPEVYTGGEAPAASGARDAEGKLCSAVYTYGWVVSRAELYEAINGRPTSMHFLLSQIYFGATKLLSMWWREKGYDRHEYK
jgi:hypothetical protein